MDHPPLFILCWTYDLTEEHHCFVGCRVSLLPKQRDHLKLKVHYKQLKNRNEIS